MCTRVHCCSSLIRGLELVSELVDWRNFRLETLSLSDVTNDLDDSVLSGGKWVLGHFFPMVERAVGEGLSRSLCSEVLGET